jgi:hypothetical protein
MDLTYERIGSGRRKLKLRYKFFREFEASF